MSVARIHTITTVLTFGVVGAFMLSALALLTADAIVAGTAPKSDPHRMWSEVQLWIVSVATAAAWFALRNRAAPVSPIAT